MKKKKMKFGLGRVDNIMDKEKILVGLHCQQKFFVSSSVKKELNFSHETHLRLFQTERVC